MHIPDISRMFNDFEYEKSSKEIIAAMTNKIAALKDKVTIRTQRLKETRESHKITDEVLIKLLQAARNQSRAEDRATYSVSNMVSKGDGNLTEEVVIVGAGVVNMLLTENDFIESEHKQIARMEVIVRNLKDLPDDKGIVHGHKLSEVELVFLGF